MRAKYAVICDNAPLCAAFAGNGIFPIHRRNVPNDDDGDNHFGAANYVEAVHNELIASGVKGWVHLGNELGSYTPDRTAAWVLDGVKKANAIGATLVVCNWANMNPIPGYFDYPAWKPVLRALADGGHVMGFHRGVTGQYDTFDKALAGGAIGGFEALQKTYGLRIAITEFGATKDNKGYSTWYADRYGALCEQAYRWYGEHGVLFMAHFTLDEWNVSPGFGLLSNPDLIQTFARINQEIISMPTTTPEPPGLSDPFPTKTVVGLTLRTVPSVSGITIRIMPSGTPVTAYKQPLTEKDGYTWAFVKEDTGNSGYTALADKYGSSFYNPPLPPVVVTPPPVEPPPAETVEFSLADVEAMKADVAHLTAILNGAKMPADGSKIILPVPFVSQQGSDAAYSPNDCGIAALLMLTRYVQSADGWLVPDVPTVDDLIPYTPLSKKPDALMTFNAIILLAKQLGYRAEYRDGLTPDKVRAQIALGTPVMCLVDYSVYNLKGAKIPHFMVTSGYDGSVFVTQDSYLQGANVRISADTLDAAMKTVPQNSGSYMGLVLVR